MSIDFPMATDFPTILTALRKHLVDDGVVASKEAVIFVARTDDLPHLKGDKDILVRPGGLRPPQDIVQGAGRLSRIYRVVELILRTRVAKDKRGSDEIWLNDDDRGLFAFEMAVIDSLQMFQPTATNPADPSTEIEILGEPMRLLPTTPPDHRIETQGRKEGWGSSTMPFEVMFELDIDQTRQ